MTAYKMQPWPKGRYKRYRSTNSCVRNASLLAWEYPEGLTLVRGYALNGEMWFGHWWCVDTEGRVVDPTWKNEGLAYIGVETVDAHAHSVTVRASGEWELGLSTLAPSELHDDLARAAAVGGTP